MDENNLKTTVLLEVDIPSSYARIKDQLPEIQKLLAKDNGLKLNLDIQTTNIETQVKTITNQLKSSLKEQKLTVSDFGFNTNLNAFTLSSISDEIKLLNQTITDDSIQFFDKLKYALTDVKMPLHEVLTKISAYNNLNQLAAEEQENFKLKLESSSSILSSYLKTVGSGQASISGFIAYLKGVGTAAQASAAGVKILSAAMNALGSLAITFVITKVIESVMKLANSYREAAARASELAQAHRDAASAAAERAVELDTIIQRYEALGDANYLDADRRQELLEIEADLLVILGDEAYRLDLIHGSYENILQIMKQIRQESIDESLRDMAEAYVTKAEASSTLILMQNEGSERQVLDGAITKIKEYGSENINWRDPWHMTVDGSLVEMYEIFQDLEELFRSDESQKTLHGKLLASKDALTPVYNELMEIGKEALNLVDVYTRLNLNISQLKFDSLEDYYSQREALIGKLMNHESLAKMIEDGLIGYLDLETKIDNQLAEGQKYYYELAQKTESLLAQQEEAIHRANGLTDQQLWGDEPLEQSEYIAQLKEINNEINELNDLISMCNFEFEFGDPYGGMLSSINNVADELTHLTDIQSIIANGFIISTEEARKFAETFPEILVGMEALGQDQIRLSEETVNANQIKLNNQIDTAVSELELEKALVDAKGQLIDAQILAVKNGNTAEIEMSTENAVAQMAILQELDGTCQAFDVSKALSNEIALGAMTEDWDSFDGAVAEAAGNMDDNIAAFFTNAMENFKTTCQNQIFNINTVVAACDHLARAVNNAALGIETGEYHGELKAETVAGNNNYSKSGIFESYDPADKASIFSGKSLEIDENSLRTLAAEFADTTQHTLDRLEAERNIYSAQSNSLAIQIEAVKSMRLDSGTSRSSGTSSGRGAGGGSTKAAQKEIEEYIYALDVLAEAESRLKEVQEDRKDVETAISRADRPTDRIRQTGDLIKAYENEKKALEEIRDLQSQKLLSNIEILKAQGFDVSYDATSDKLLIANKEHLNNLFGITIEETNQLRQEYEALIDTTLALNDANRTTARDFADLNEEIAKKQMGLVDESLQIIDDFIRHADDFELWNEMDMTRLDALNGKLAMINKRYEDGFIPSAKKYKELIDAVSLDIYKEQKTALESIIDLTQKLIKQEAQDKVKALREQITAYQKIIDLKKKALQSTKEEDNYEKEVAKKLKSIADLQSRIAQLSLDDSREAAAQRKALEGELADLQEELADYQADYAYNAQLDSLDKQYETFKDEKEREIADTESAVDTTAKLYQAAIARIDNDWDALYQDLYDWNMVYGDGIETSIIENWNTATAAVKEYASVVDALSGIKTSNSLSNNGGNTSTGDTGKVADVSALVAKMKSNSAAWQALEVSGDPNRLTQQNVLQKDNAKLVAEIEQLLGKNIYYNQKSGTWHIGSANGTLLYDIYHDGGIVGSPDPASASSIKDNEVLALLQKGEMVLDQPKKSTLYELVDFTGYLMAKLGSAATALPLFTSTINPLDALSRNTPELPSQPQTTLGDMNLTFDTQVHISGNPDADTARQAGEQIGETVMSYISDSFSKRGLNRIGSGFLKP